MRNFVASVLLQIAASQALPAECPTQARERYEPRSFLGYACDDDCERHKAGFAWAVEHTVSALEACAPLGSTEAEGCRAHVEEHLSPEQAGDRWARENEITDPCLCEGAGEGFRAGCLRGLGSPWAVTLGAPNGGPGTSGRFAVGAATGKLPR